MRYRRTFAIPFVAVGLFVPTVAHATDFSLKVEPGVAIPLTSPQSDLYDIGGAQSVKGLFGVTRWLDLGPAVSFMMLPSTTAGADSGVVWGFGGGLRLKRPHDAVSAWGISPWLDADMLYMRTGPLNRPGFDVGVGASVPIGEERMFWIGPFVRYVQTIQLDRDGFDNRDAKVLQIGLSFEFGTGIERERKDAPPLPPEVRIVTQERIIKEVVTKDGVCPDRDGDGLQDSVDRCPDVKGPIDNWGCPAYNKVVIAKDRLELKEKIQFAFDKAKLEDASFPILNEVVHALTDNKNFKVEIDGHTSSEGGDAHNQPLSEARAASVLEFLVAHGVPRERLVSRGFASSVPIDTNKTKAGRENNRRVEFLLTFNIVNNATSETPQ